MTYDVLIKGGSVVDGSGSDSVLADIAVVDGKIAEIAPSIEGDAREQINASGMVVTPGFIDPHTHFDGQATWDQELAPTSWHGITTAVMGNCGVGFAPAHRGKQQRDELIELMEGVEDIPGTALWQGMSWNWESFPEYLDELDRLPRKIDVMAHVPHGALRPYVMGERGLGKEHATAKDIEVMTEIVRESVAAGAAGFSTNRMALHKSLSGISVPGTFAEEDELLALTRPMGELGHGVLQVIPDGVVGENPGACEREIDMYRRISLETGVPVTFSLAIPHNDLELSDRILQLVDKANADGARLIPQCQARAAGYLMGWESMNPFLDDCPTAREVHKLAPGQRRQKAADPEIRAKILSEFDRDAFYSVHTRAMAFPTTYLVSGDYVCEPDHNRSLIIEAERLGVDPIELLYDWMTEGMAQSFFSGYGDGNLDRIVQQLNHPAAVPSLADGGAHVSIMCDAGVPSFMLQHYVRERSRGTKMKLESVVEKLTSKPAAIYNLKDRGLLQKGLRADINVIDVDNIKLKPLETLYDLPLGAPRLMQAADGYIATLCNGDVTYHSGKGTESYPGGLVRLGH